MEVHETAAAKPPAQNEADSISAGESPSKEQDHVSTSGKRKAVPTVTGTEIDKEDDSSYPPSKKQKPDSGKAVANREAAADKILKTKDVPHKRAETETKSEQTQRTSPRRKAQETHNDSDE